MTEKSVRKGGKTVRKTASKEAPEWEVVLIEDNPQRLEALERALKARLRSRFKVSCLDNTPVQDDKRPYDDRLEDALQDRRLALIVTDRDLSGQLNYPGLSEAVVARVAAKLDVPVCIYAAGKDDSFLERRKSGGGGRVILDSATPTEMARKVDVIASGFHAVRSWVEEVVASKEKHGRYRGPAAALADLLDAPEVGDHLALYTRGDQRMLDGFAPSGGMPSSTFKLTPDTVRRIALALGVWLYDSVLRFPGIVVGRTGAASFLGIDEHHLREDEVIKMLAKARYNGPFADPDAPRWWRHRLVELLDRSRVSDGLSLAKKVLEKDLKPCRCSVDRKPPAGFVCVITGDPVCAAHSVAEVGWLPRGADLSRVRQDIYEQIGPWIGMS